MEDDLKILTSRQRNAYELRQEGLTYQAIGERMGITGKAAGDHVKAAERRLRQYRRFQEQEEWNRQEVLISMSQGELSALMESLAWWGRAARRQVYRGQKGSEWLGAAPYCVQVVKEFAERTQMDLYGAVRWRPFEE